MGTKRKDRRGVEEDRARFEIPGMLDDPGHHFGGDLVGGHDQVALVLSLSVVHDHDAFPIPEALESLLDRV
jgi:hypothetical protein